MPMLPFKVLPLPEFPYRSFAPGWGRSSPDRCTVSGPEGNLEPVCYPDHQHLHGSLPTRGTHLLHYQIPRSIFLVPIPENQKGSPRNPQFTLSLGRINGWKSSYHGTNKWALVPHPTDLNPFHFERIHIRWRAPSVDLLGSYQESSLRQVNYIPVQRNPPGLIVPAWPIMTSFPQPCTVVVISFALSESSNCPQRMLEILPVDSHVPGSSTPLVCQLAMVPPAGSNSPLYRFHACQPLLFFVVLQSHLTQL